MKCKAKAKSTGKPCRRDAVNGYEVCVVHGGKTPRGAQSSNFKHGAYAKYATGDLAPKIADFEQGDALSLLGELSLTRALLAAFMEKYKESGLLMIDTLGTVSMLLENIRKLTDSIVRQRNDTALTAFEIAFIMTRLPELVVKYIDEPDKQASFLGELFGVFGRPEQSLPAGQPAPNRLAAVTSE